MYSVREGWGGGVRYSCMALVRGGRGANNLTKISLGRGVTGGRKAERQKEQAGTIKLKRQARKKGQKYQKEISECFTYSSKRTAIETLLFFFFFYSLKGRYCHACRRLVDRGLNGLPRFSENRPEHAGSHHGRGGGRGFGGGREGRREGGKGEGEAAAPAFVGGAEGEGGDPAADDFARIQRLVDHMEK